MGPFRERLTNGGQSAIHIPQHQSCWKPQSPDAILKKPCVPPLVARWIVCNAMGVPINLNA